MRADMAALDASSTMFGCLQMGDNWKFTEADRDSMIADLDAMREMLTQMGYHDPHSDRHSLDDWYFHLSRVGIAAMAMYLSGKLQEVVVDG